MTVGGADLLQILAALEEVDPGEHDRFVSLLTQWSKAGEPMTCPWCANEFDSYTALRSHVPTHHEGPQ